MPGGEAAAKPVEEHCPTIVPAPPRLLSTLAKAISWHVNQLSFLLPLISLQDGARRTNRGEGGPRFNLP